MKCGQFEERNLEYVNNFSVDNYFKRLIDRELSDTQDDRIVVFDVGAHKGESASFFSGLFPAAEIYSFEPNPEAAKIIKKLALVNVIVNQAALSDYDGVASFNVQDISHLSSLYKVNNQSMDSLGYAEKERHTTVEVPVIRGDNFAIRNNIQVIDFLKIDVQANEAKTIAGFSSILQRIRNVFVEVSLYDFYENRSTIQEIEILLPDFYLYDIYEISKNPKTLGIDWATLVYRNKNERI